MKATYSLTLAKPKFFNKVIDKKELKNLMAWAFTNYGTGRASYVADKLKELGFHYATCAGISLSVEDLRVPPTKRSLLYKTDTDILFTEQRYERGDITIVERFQNVVDAWNNSSESLKNEVVKYFKEADPLNPVYIMAFSGARGNISQVRQLVGMRGLMADPHGQIIDFPIKSNFREGLTVTEYVISCYGARKGLVDTALRTADSGYLTRRLVDVAQDIIIREVDCGSVRGILLTDMKDKHTVLIPLKSRLFGRVLMETLFIPDSGVILANINQDLSHDLSKLVLESGMKSLYVRSPLTCESTRSVCQFCYGWSLAHGSLVDLGEAVGIIAAQSIGEPGTQLTMRTFHTGGVFTGESIEHIRAPSDGVLRLPNMIRLRPVRTRHGREAFLLEEGLNVEFFTYNLLKLKMELKQGTILFLNDNGEFRAQQVLGESNARSKALTEIFTKDLPAGISGQIYFSDLVVEENLDRQGKLLRTALHDGLIWVLSGDVYDIPPNAILHVSKKDFVKKNETLASAGFVSEYAGTIRFLSTRQESLSITTSSATLDSVVINIGKESASTSLLRLFDFKDERKFLLHCSPGDKVIDGQIVGEFPELNCRTYTGGLVKYAGSGSCKLPHHSDGYEVPEGFTFYWIPEETHFINSPASSLLVNADDLIREGSEIARGIRSMTGGLVSIVEGKGTCEVSVKPGVLYPTESVSVDEFEPKIFQPGEMICDGFYASAFSFVEKIKHNTIVHYFVRPAVQYCTREVSLDLNQTLSYSPHAKVRFNVMKKILFGDGNKIKSARPSVLLKTYLVLELHSDKGGTLADIEFLPLTSSGACSLRCSVTEHLHIKRDGFSGSNAGHVQTRLCVKDGDVVTQGTTIAESRLMCKSDGEVVSLVDNFGSGKKILILAKNHEEAIQLHGETPQVPAGGLVRYGDQIAKGISASSSGQVLRLEKNALVLRLGKPYLVSSNSILHVSNLDLVHKGSILANLACERLKTGDIVQGLPKIEEILEARKPKDACTLAQKPGMAKIRYQSDGTTVIEITEINGIKTDYGIHFSRKYCISNGEHLFLGDCLTDGHRNSHELLDVFFSFYKNFLNVYEAARLSLQRIQLHLVGEIQQVYRSQNVDISDKHIEIIVRQMTSKVKVEDGGDTTLLPGELIDLRQIGNINEAMAVTKGFSAMYSPILMGITKTSLNTDSFISAASFQETTRVLTEAAVEGKADWLRGLKENVIIGRLIPAGTGFNSYTEHAKFASFNRAGLSSSSIIKDFCNDDSGCC